MKMLKQRFIRERDTGWMSSAASSAPSSPPLAVGELVATLHSPVSILTNAHMPASGGVQQPNPPASAASATCAANQQTLTMDRPRKKLSFRDPEVTSTTTEIHLAALPAGQLVTLKDQGFSDSIENVDLEVHPLQPQSRSRSRSRNPNPFHPVRANT